MKKHGAENERSKRRYGAFLKEGAMLIHYSRRQIFRWGLLANLKRQG